MLDINDGVTLFPGVDQVGHAGTTVVLDAQVSGATVSSYNWNTAGLVDATRISGTRPTSSCSSGIPPSSTIR